MTRITKDQAKDLLAWGIVLIAGLVLFFALVHDSWVDFFELLGAVVLTWAVLHLIHKYLPPI